MDERPTFYGRLPCENPGLTFGKTERELPANEDSDQSGKARTLRKGWQSSLKSIGCLKAKFASCRGKRSESVQLAEQVTTLERRERERERDKERTKFACS